MFWAVLEETSSGTGTDYHYTELEGLDAQYFLHRERN
jgi:hypothetical protein